MVGRPLAQRLGYESVDNDRTIEQRHGAIATLFASQGEEACCERTLAVKLAGRSGVVICLVAETIHDRVVAGDSGTVRSLLVGDDARRRIDGGALQRCREGRVVRWHGTSGLPTPGPVYSDVGHSFGSVTGRGVTG